MYPSQPCLRIGFLLIFAAAVSNATAQEQSAQPASFVEFGADSRISEQQIEGWIAQLGDDSYQVREAAAERLLSVGGRAREALRRAASSADPETHAAAERLVALIDQVEFEQQLQAFADDEDGRLGITLPGWKEFRDAMGNDRQMRTLFIEMQRQEAPLLRAVFEGSGSTGQNLWIQRARYLLTWQAQLRNRQKMPPLGSCAAVVFVDAVASDPSGQQSEMAAQIVGLRPIQNAMRSGDHQGAIRKLVAHWLVHCPNRSPSSLVQRLQIGQVYDLKEVVPLALEIAQAKPNSATPSQFRGNALLVVAKLGNQDHIDDLEPLLADESPCQIGGPANTANQLPMVQIRDVALAVSLHLAGENPRKYGFAHLKANENTVFMLGTLGLADDEARKQALAKWRALPAGTAKPASNQ
jgi:hypothetical protein